MEELLDVFQALWRSSLCATLAWLSVYAYTLNAPGWLHIMNAAIILAIFFAPIHSDYRN